MPSPERVIIEQLFSISNKEGVKVPFILNPAQADFDENLSGRDIIPKARQIGFSMYILARSLARCLGIENRRVVIISHTTEATQRLLSRIHFMLDNFRGPDAVLKYSNRNEITFPKNGSGMYIGTAGSKDLGVGDTITDLHCSEIPRWKNAGGLLADLLQAVPLSGNIIHEATGKGVGNWYHSTCMRCVGGSGPYKLHFYNWLWDTESSFHLSEEQKDRLLNTLDSSMEEDILFDQGVTLGQLAWRRWRLSELDYDLMSFKEQYPYTLDECFQSRTHSYFHRVSFEETSEWIQDEQETYMHRLSEHPIRGIEYTMGIDSSGGVGRDSAVIEVIRNDNFEQVAEWRHNKTEPDILALKARDIGTRFNMAFANIEKNNHGILTLSKMLDIYPPERIHRNIKVSGSQREEFGRLADFGITTTSISKAFMISNLRSVFAEGAIFHSTVLKSEIDTFREENGKLQAEESCHDDTVMAMALATYGTAYGIGVSSTPIIAWA